MTCSTEGRVLHIRKAVDPPANAWGDSRIICELAQRLGKERYFPYQSTREIFDELREASRGGIADYYGISYERIDREMGVFWPCPSEDHPGTPRLMEGGVSMFPDGKCRMQVTEWRESGDPVAEDFPLYFTTGRVVSQYLSGTQTRRIGGLVDHVPRAAGGDSSAPGRAARHRGRRLGSDHIPTRRTDAASTGCKNNSA